MPPDRLNEIGVLRRREIEARILAPLIAAFEREFGQPRVRELLRATIVEIAQRQGAELAAAAGGNSLADFEANKGAWTKDGALEIDIVESTPSSYGYNVTRCRYAEMYHALGIPELGALLSCNRDFRLIEGFNPEIELERTQTIMEGAAFCDFRYRTRGPAPTENANP